MGTKENVGTFIGMLIVATSMLGLIIFFKILQAPVSSFYREFFIIESLLP